ncbi:hypothetical protein JQV27_17870 [Sulfitobacter mediterraneus]|uniref:hypothetical protein n=1 Tax=Sulfitobacter mediterraneus TaxID=83219 RepID=UPI00193A478D|nr:hypothetical protein [Sulfitobacter mediterraneus]MBM1642544.1 hypothetical protein [Sulfitobacter mediterraneus]MBM1646592.1 hypothetical protein [Sulfitobacter mediterraneus]MBM1658733.1 hypothetical protein [Sulfitobacter mediterraneus]MBM1666824.1 hypothetical protein [Sulfitobacter mediterraneus]
MQTVVNGRWGTKDSEQSLAKSIRQATAFQIFRLGRDSKGSLVLVDLIVEMAITFSDAIPMASELVHRMGLSVQQNTGRQLAFALLNLRMRFALGPSPLI